VKAWILRKLGAKPSGTWYCTVHNGIGNEDDYGCDFSYEDTEVAKLKCEKRELFYV
jgi:hypothetical protein